MGLQSEYVEISKHSFYAYADIYKHIQTYSGIFRNYSSIFRTFCKYEIFRTLPYGEPEVYSEPWYIQSPWILRTQAYSEP